jgi:hypothetical protein
LKSAQGVRRDKAALSRSYAGRSGRKAATTHGVKSPPVHRRY